MTDLSTPSHPPATDAERRARTAFDLVQRDPSRAGRDLRGVIADSSASVRAGMVARWGLGRLLHDQGRIADAGLVYEEAVHLADVVADPGEEALIRVSWSLCLQAAGDSDAALAQLDLAEPALECAPLGRLLMQRGFVFMFSGAVDAAVDEYDEALPLLRAGDDLLAQARLLGNRGIARLQLGDSSGARHDFIAAQQLADELGQHLLSAGALHNLGYLSGRLGQLPEALRSFDLARERYAALGSPGRLLAALDTDQCEVHLAAGLAVEARDVAVRLVDDAVQAGNQLQLAESHLLLARAHLLLGDRITALDESQQAARLFRATRRPAWAALATYVGVLAAADDTPTDAAAADRRSRARQLSSLSRAATTLEQVGWVTEAAEVRVLSGRVAIGLGRLDIARTELKAAAQHRHKGSPNQRAEAWHASALLHVADGNLAAAKRAISNGLRVIDRHRATLGARELRVRVSAHGENLARLGLRLALRSGRPPEVLTAAERWRAGALANRTPDRPTDDDVATDLAELRRLDGVMRAAVLDEATSGAGRTTVTKTRGSIEALERSITRRSRMAIGDPRAVSGRLDARTLRRQLGARALVEYVEAGDHLHAVVVTPRRSSLIDLGTFSAIGEVHDHLLFAIRSLVSLPDGHPRAGAARRSFDASRQELDERLVTPLGLGQSAAVVIVPTGRLHSMPWGAFTTLQRCGGDVTVSPSAAWWVRGADDPGDRRLLLVGGTGLPAVERELEDVGALYGAAQALTAGDATCETVLAAIAAADIAHIATHGTFRADNPMFSSLDMADGPLMIHDLEHVAAVPWLVILTACHAGRSGVYAGDELLGTATSLLSLGVGSVIAPVLAVPDDSTSRLAVDLHRALRRRKSPSAALGSAVAAGASDSARSLAVAAAFQCIGTDVSSPSVDAL